MCFLENKEEIFVNISSDTYYELDFCVILNTKYLILNKYSNPKNLFSSPLYMGIFEVAVGKEGKNDVHFVFFTAYRLKSSIGLFEIAGIILL